MNMTRPGCHFGIFGLESHLDSGPEHGDTRPPLQIYLFFKDYKKRFSVSYRPLRHNTILLQSGFPIVEAGHFSR